MLKNLLEEHHIVRNTLWLMGLGFVLGMMVGAVAQQPDIEYNVYADVQPGAQELCEEPDDVE